MQATEIDEQDLPPRAVGAFDDVPVVDQQHSQRENANTTNPEHIHAVEVEPVNQNFSHSSEEADDKTETSEESSSNKITQRLSSPKFWIAFLLLSFIVFVVVDSATTRHLLEETESLLDWIEENPVGGIFLLVIVYFLATVSFLPGSILTLGAGFVFSMAFGLRGGVVAGTVSVFFGASLGGLVSFLLARFLLRDQVGKLSQKYAVFQALDQALAENGLKIFILLRLSPLIPFNVMNYIGGVSSVSFRDYAIAMFAILPGTVLYVFLGASAGSLADSAMSGQDPTVTIIVVAVGATFGILAVGATTHYARQELNSVLEERQAAEAAVEGSDADIETGEAESSESIVSAED